jgi:hypothetical protein
MKKQTIAVLASTSALALVMSTRVSAAFPKAEVVTIDKVSDRPAGAEIASFGIPSYIPGNQDTVVHNFGTKIRNNATAEERSHQWEVIRDKESSEEAVAEQLGDFRTVRIQSESTIKDRKVAFADIRIAKIEAEEAIRNASTPEEKVEALEAYSKALNDAYDMLVDVLA